MLLALMMTYQCNFYCGHCMVNSSHEYSCVKLEVVEKFLEILKNNKPENVYLLGGEVLLHIDLVEKIVKEVKKVGSKVRIFSNGTFLLNEKMAERVKNMNVSVRISDDRFHRKQWGEKLGKLIYNSKYYVAKSDIGSLDYVIPVGRAYKDFKDCKKVPDCSLYTGIYDERYSNGHRYMVMMNGDVNLYCATVQGALANVFEDENITYEMLVDREKTLHNYIMKNQIKEEKDTYMANICNKCSKYKVTADKIYFDGECVAELSDYLSEV